MRPILVLLGVAAALTGGGLVAHASHARAEELAEAATAARARQDVRAADIGFYTARVQADPAGALDRLRLGALLLERSRAEGSERDLVAAERLARESLALREAHNSAAWHLLAGALMGQHRFREALEAARHLVASEPDNAGARALTGEVLLELGAYPEADSIFAALGAMRRAPQVAPRYARWLELRGQAGEARRLLEASRDRVAREDGPPDLLAWYDLRLADLAFRFGNLAMARARLDEGRAHAPTDWRLQALEARVTLREGRPARAIALADSVIAVTADAGSFAVLADGWLALGDPAQSEGWTDAVEAMALDAPAGATHRATLLFLLDRGRRMSEILARAVRDVEARPDPYGWDLLAWALFRNGRTVEARGVMGLALAHGTDDPLLHVHARTMGVTP